VPGRAGFRSGISGYDAPRSGAFMKQRVRDSVSEGESGVWIERAMAVLGGNSASAWSIRITGSTGGPSWRQGSRRLTSPRRPEI
jgi:hypothetical protein